MKELIDASKALLAELEAQADKGPHKDSTKAAMNKAVTRLKQCAERDNAKNGLFEK